MILFFLFTSNGPLLQLFLIPVELQFDLFYFFIDSKDSNLYVIETFLMVDNNFVEFLDLIFKTTALSFSHLPEMVLCFSFFVFRVNEGLCVEKLLVDILQMLF